MKQQNNQFSGKKGKFSGARKAPFRGFNGKFKRPLPQDRNKTQDTSWNESSSWYNDLVGAGGHYYHTHVIIPNVLKLLNLKGGSSVLDIGCGQGVLSRALPVNVSYLGIDAADELLAHANKMNKDKKKVFRHHDATEVKQLHNIPFSHAAAILSLQNMKEPAKAIQLASKNLSQNGTFVMVLNHPAFRIPRQSGWDTFPTNKLQYRWITKYMSPMEIPFITHLPGGKKINSWSFHHSISDYAKFLKDAGFSIVDILEWTSDKESTGKHAKKENTARDEFPLFMTIVAKKNG